MQTNTQTANPENNTFNHRKYGLVLIGLVATYSIVGTWFYFAHRNFTQQAPGTNMAFIANLFSLGALIIVLWLFIWQQQQRKHYQTLYQSEAELRIRIDQQRIVLGAIQEGVIATTPSGHVAMMNSAAERITGWSWQNAKGKPIHDIFNLRQDDALMAMPPHPIHPHPAATDPGSTSGTSILIKPDGQEIPIAYRQTPVYDSPSVQSGFVIVFHNFSDEQLSLRLAQARLNLNSYAETHTVEQLLTYSLDMAGELLHSPIGFYHFIDADQNSISLQAWSTATLEKFCQAEGKGRHYPVDQAGVWADCVRQGKPIVHNDYENLPQKKGLPPEHARIIREVVVPVKRDGRIVAIFGVGNKAADYTDKDVEIISFFADVTWQIIENKRASTMLQESEAKFRALFQNSHAVMMLIDPETGMILDANPAACIFYGWSYDTLINKHIDEINTLNDHQIKREMRKAVANQRQFFQFKHRLASGEVRDVEVFSSVIRQGRKTLLHTIVHDVTARKQAEMRLQANEERLTHLFTVSPAIVYTLDPNTFHATWVSGNITGYLGYDEVDLSEPSWWVDHLYPPDKANALSATNSLLIKGHIIHEYRFYKKNGDLIWVRDELRLLRGKDGQPEEIIGAWIDITAQKRTSVALKESELRYEKLLDIAPVGIAVHANNEIVFSNPAGARLLGAETPDEIIGLKLDKVVHPDYWQKTNEAIQQMLASGKDIMAFDNVLQRLDGSLVQVDVMGTPMQYRGETAVQVIITDITERKQFEAHLRENQDLLVTAEEVAKMGSWKWDLQTQKVTWSQGMFHLFGIDPTHFDGDLNQVILDRVHPDDIAAVTAANQKVLTEKKPVPMTYRLVLPTGVERTVWAQGKFVYDKTGKPIALTGYVQDITDQKKTEAQINLQAAALASAANAIVITDRDGTILWTNPAFTQLTGYTFQEARDQNPRILKSGKHRPDFYKGMWQTIKSGDVWRSEIINKRKDGTFYIEEETITPVFNEAGEITHFIAIKQDISKRKQAEQEREQLVMQIHQQAQQLQEIMDTVPEGVVLLDAKFTIIQANPAARRLLSILTQADVGDTLSVLGERPLPDLLIPDPATYWHEIKQMDHICQIAARPILNETGTNGWVLALHEITEQHQIMEQLHRQERLAAVGQLAAGIAHDFNNLMAVIVLYTELLKLKVDLPQKDQEHINTIIRQANRATELIQQILDFSRRSTMEQKPLNLLSILKEEIKLLKRTLPEHIEIQLDYYKNDLIILADVTRIQQVIMNLAVNARDAMPNGGQLAFTLNHLDLSELAPAPVLSMTPGRWIHLAIADSGEGIAPENIDHVFEPFFTTKDPGKGTGLGLAQVYGIISQHGGFINVTSQVGVGTTFDIYLPAYGVRDETAVFKPETGPLHYGDGACVMVVEDEPLLRTAVVDSLRHWDYEVLEARDGEEALFLITEFNPQINLILSDMVMPKMGGMAFVRALRQLGIQTPVVFMTGHPLDMELNSLDELGVRATLIKPVHSATLSQIVAKNLG